MNERIKTLDKHGGMKTRQELTIFASGVGKSIFWSRKMNERIKSLLAKAHLDVMEDLGDIDSNQVAERFADLIIEMCADHILNTSDRYRKEYFAHKVLELRSD